MNEEITADSIIQFLANNKTSIKHITVIYSTEEVVGEEDVSVIGDSKAAVDWVFHEAVLRDFNVQALATNRGGVPDDTVIN